MARGSGAGSVVFGLVTPLDHPPEATFLFTLYIYIVFPTTHAVPTGWSRGGGRGGSRDQKRPCLPRSSRQTTHEE